MFLSLLLLNCLLLLISIINFATIRRPSKTMTTDKSVVVLLPVRNEEENIERVLRELDAQVGVVNYKVFVIDDNSDDATYELAKKFSSERIHLISAPEPEVGWIGKVSALSTGYQATVAEMVSAPEIVISIDADVHFEEDAIVRAVATLDESNLDFISPYPRQIAITWAERLAQPLLQWSWMSTVFLKGAEKIPQVSTVICNGQFLVMKYESLKTIGGFQSVAHKVLDDIELGRSFVRHGFRGVVIDGSEIASTRMYSTFDALRRGYGKSLHTAFGSIIGSIFASLFIFFTGILPLLLTLTGNLIAGSALVAIIGTRLVSARASRGRLRDAFLHSASSALLLYLLYYSWRNRKRAEWKGRTL